MNEARLDPSFRDGDWMRLPEAARMRALGFAADVLRFNRATNLISRSDPEREIARLLEESLRAALALEPWSGSRWLDVGSGGGIPALPLVCVYPDLEIDLVERRRARCDFLRRELGAVQATRARVVEGAVEELYGGPLYDVVTAKAVAEPGAIEALCDPVVGEQGSLVLFQRAGWLPIGGVSPGGWSVVETWYGGGGAVPAEGRGGFRLVRSR